MKLCELKHEVAGFFRFEKFKADGDGNEIKGTREVAADWFPNLILDQGLNQMATSDTYLNACQVGSGTTTPANGQTALSSLVAGTITRPTNVTSVASSPPYYVARSVTFRFAEGAAAGNLAEVGVGTAVSGTTLFSRSLIKDSLGNPTTITILSDESLDVIYQLRYYVPPSDITGTIIATGNIGGSYDYTLRSANVTTVSDANGWSLPARQDFSSPNNAGYRAFNGPIGNITEVPSGVVAVVSRPTSLSYVPGSFYIDRLITASSAQANLSGGIRSILAQLGVGTYQIEFDPPIPKTSNDVVQLTLRLSWGRRP